MTVTTGNDRRADAVGNGSLLVFAYDFLILANTDIKVYHVDAAGLSTLLTLTTDYTVSGVGTSGGGNITLTSAYAVAGTPAATESILMLGETAKTQETDLLQNGAYNAEVQEAIGDKLTLIANEHERERDRSLRLALSDSAVTVSTLLPVVVGNTTIAWNAAGTALVEGPTVTAISGAAASATAAAASATAASASASTSSTNAAATAADLVATNQDTIDTAADLVQTAADVLLTAADVVTIAGATASTAADVVLTHADVVLTNADVVSTTADAVATAADLVQTNIDQLAVAADLVATNQDTIDTAADLVATNQDTIDTAADLVQTNLDQISAAASAVATAADLVLTNADQISAAANAAITAQDAIDTAADAVATAADLVLTDADQVSAAASAAAAAASYDLFDDRYLGSKSSAPTVDNDGNALITGALYFNSTTDILYVRNSASAWQSASSSISTTFQRFEYTAGGGETSFTGADDNSNTLSYDSGFEYTFLNGVLLNDGDYTSTTGTSVTGLTALTAGDKLEIIAHGTATPGDFYTKAAADAKYELIGGFDLTAIADGSAGAPSLANSGDTNTGVYFPSADTVAITAGGVEQFRFGSNPIPGGMKNLFLNGSCTVSQRGTSFTGLGSGTSDEYTLDRWCLSTIDTSTARWTVSQATSGGITGKDPWLKCLNTTADASPAAGEGQLLQQKMEGYTAQPLLGPTDGYIDGFTVSADMILHADGASSISFPATVSCVAYTVDTGRGCVIDATITSDATWQRVNFVFPADTSGTFNIDNTVGFRVGFGLYAGTSRDAADGSWFNAATNAAVSEDAENIADATNNYIGFTNVQLEVGSVATDFAHEDYGTTLAKCYRYLEIIGKEATYTRLAVGYVISTTEAYGNIYYAPKRAAPTFTKSGTLYGNSFAGTVGGTLAVSWSSIQSAMLQLSGGSSLTGGQAVSMATINGVGDYLIISSEL